MGGKTPPPQKKKEEISLDNDNVTSEISSIKLGFPNLLLKAADFIGPMV